MATKKKGSPLPFTKFHDGLRQWNIVECDTANDYVKALVAGNVVITEKTEKEHASTVYKLRKIFLNKEVHHDLETYIHTFCHEILHVVWYGWGAHTDEQHNEVEIDGKARVLARIFLTGRK